MPPPTATSEVSEIDDVLPGFVRGSTGGLGAGDDLVRVVVDLAHFPDAICNDGTGAIFYVRRYTNAADAGKWQIHLRRSRWPPRRSPAECRRTVSPMCSSPKARRRVRQLSPEEAALWARVTATIQPLSRELTSSPIREGEPAAERTVEGGGSPARRPPPPCYAWSPSPSRGRAT